MNNITIALHNRDLPHDNTPRTVQGHSGKGYATARFVPAQGCFVAKLTLDEYDKAIDDLSRAWHLPMRRWVPKVIVDAESMEQSECDRLREQIAELMASGGKQEPVKSEEAKLRGMKPFTLRKLAQSIGIEVGKSFKVADLIPQILAKQTA